MKTPEEKYTYFNKVLGALSNIDLEIQREINLAKSRKKAGVFICALALLCYTEYAGRIEEEIFNKKKLDEKRRFEEFFKKLGPAYAQFLINNPKTYDIFRCGLAHEYYVKKTCIIRMLKSKEDNVGIQRDSKGIYYFIVEKYFEDFKKAFKKLGDKVASGTIYSSK